MRRMLILAVAVAAVAAPTAGATASEPFAMHIKGEWGGASPFAPCPIDPTITCERGQIKGYGKVAQTYAGSSVPEGDCVRITGTAVTYLLDGSGTLTTQESLLDCTPGASGSSPGNVLHSFGNPVKSFGSFSITGGTGVFAGASGSGTESAKAAGDTIVITYAGTLTLPD